MDTLTILTILAITALLIFGKYHKNLLISLINTEKPVAYGVYSTLSEMIFYHFGHLIFSLFIPNKKRLKTRKELVSEIEDKFLNILNKEESWNANNVIITHSCRTIFYCIIKSLLSLKKEGNKLKICCCTMQFGSFYRLLRALELAENAKIEFYEIDLNLNDWTLNTLMINEEEIKSCDLILCQHLFGVAFEQNLLFELGHKYNIAILEDCVQSGSLFSKYKGHQLSDICIWSGGLDKTPSCFGGGFGYFYNTKHGKTLYQHVKRMTEGFRVDSFKDRFLGLFNQTLHLLITKNSFYLNNVAGFLLYFYFAQYKKYAFIKWYELSLKVRKNKAITPFQHKSSIFLTKPSLAQLYSIRYGINKNYDNIIMNEIKKRELFLSNIPSKYHCILFPWITDKIKRQLIENKGIAEFTWVYSADSHRIELNEYLSNNWIITMINTTWVYHKDSKLKENNSKFICDNMTYLPNLNEMNNRQIIHTAKVLTNYCKLKKW